MEICLTEKACASPEETRALGECLARTLKPGMVIALYGGLGAGKTCLTKGIAKGLGVTETITSPTYTILCEYVASIGDRVIPLYHIDAYRLNGDEDFESTGAGEVIGGGGITIIEWSERIPGSIPGNAITVEIDITGPHSRIFRIRGLEALP
ncbi:MAG: tRNA (adenosine(37)-N6)-threonylcarbamoyltransferase complex ATPase subunit type 1 TsaE [Treponema sp.]|nr:tRNA (adenosine(37)-N6)-threonylcarbamoyltransferase complex ATPase subunit type 1 TsaE [Treponema sp.]